MIPCHNINLFIFYEIGFRNLSHDAYIMLGRRPSIFFIVCWCFCAPAIIMVSVCCTFKKKIDSTPAKVHEKAISCTIQLPYNYMKTCRLKFGDLLWMGIFFCWTCLLDILIHNCMLLMFMNIFFLGYLCVQWVAAYTSCV